MGNCEGCRLDRERAPALVFQDCRKPRHPLVTRALAFEFHLSEAIAFDQTLGEKSDRPPKPLRPMRAGQRCPQAGRASSCQTSLRRIGMQNLSSVRKRQSQLLVNRAEERSSSDLEK